MKRLFSALALAATAALLWHSATPAQACSCDDSTVKELTSRADVVVAGTVSRVRFVGPIEEIAATLRFPYGTSTEDVKAEVVVDVERYLKGGGGESLKVRQPGPVHMIKDANGQLSVWINGGANCQLFDTQVAEPIGYRYLLFLRELEDDAFSTSTCSGSHGLAPHPDPEAPAEYNSFLDRRYAEYDRALGLPPGTLVAIANHAPLPEGSEDKFPYIPAVIAATLGPLLFVLIASFVFPAKGSRA